jgi:hypothetical protein
MRGLHIHDNPLDMNSNLSIIQATPKAYQIDKVQKPKTYQNHESTDIGKKSNALVCIDLRRDIGTEP